MEIIKMAMGVADIFWETDTYPEGRDIFLEELRKTDENAQVNYEDYPEAIVYYNRDYYKVNFTTREIKKQEIEYVAQIGNIKYATLQEAINSVNTDNQNTVIELLKDVSESIRVEENKNITIDMKKLSIETSIENEGTLQIVKGKLRGYSEFIALNNNGNFEANETVINDFIIKNNKGNVIIKNSQMRGTVPYVMIKVSNEASCMLENTKVVHMSFEVNVGGSLILDKVEYSKEEETIFINNLINNKGNITIRNNSYIAGSRTRGTYLIRNESGGNIDIIDSTIKTRNAAIYNLEGASLTISGEAYLETDADNETIRNEGTINATSGTIKNAGSSIYEVAIRNSSGVVTITPNVICIPKNDGVTVEE